MTDRGLVTFLVPAKNEASGIAATLRALPIETCAAMGYRTEVLVLDGHSTDATRTIARASGALVVEDVGHGKARAFREARPLIRGDYVVMLDGDSTYAPDAIPSMLALLSSGIDVVMGRRVVMERAMGPVHRFGNVFLSVLATTLFGRRSRDVCTGLWGFRAAALRTLPLRSEGFALESELFALSARLELRLGHVPVDYLPRAGASKLASRDGLRIAWCLLRNRFGRVTPRTEFIVRLPGPTGKEGRSSMVRVIGGPAAWERTPTAIPWADAPCPPVAPVLARSARRAEPPGRGP